MPRDECGRGGSDPYDLGRLVGDFSYADVVLIKPVASNKVRRQKGGEKRKNDRVGGVYPREKMNMRELMNETGHGRENTEVAWVHLKWGNLEFCTEEWWAHRS